MAYSQIEEFLVDLDYARIVQLNRPNIKYIRSFHIKSLNNGAKWATIINQKVLIGFYPTREAALGALVGCFYHVSGSMGATSVEGPVIGPGSPPVFGGSSAKHIQDLINSGQGTIDRSTGGNNLLRFPLIAEGGGIMAVVVEIEDYSNAIFSGSTHYYGFQVSDLEDENSWPDITATTYLTAAPASGTTISNTFSGITASLLENKAIRPVMVSTNDGITFTVDKFGLAAGIDFDVDNLVVTAELSGNPTVNTPLLYGGNAYALTTLSGAAPFKSVNYNYDWYREIPSLTGLSVTQIS